MLKLTIMYYNQIHRVIYLGAVIFLLSAFVFVACQSKDDKNRDATTEEVTADNTPSEWITFKENAEKTIADNNEKIRQLKEKINKPGTPNLDKLREKRINELENQNTKLNVKIVEYKQNEEAQSDWEKFKAEVQAELNEIEQSLKELDEK